LSFAVAENRSERFDESLLDDEDLLTRRDGGRLLWSLACCGAHVRRAVEVVDQFAPGRLAGQRPRAVLLVGDEPSRGALRVLTRLLAPAAPAVVWGGAELPHWAGPVDALLAASVDGRHPRLMSVVEQATRRGLLTAVVAPIGSPVAEAGGRSPLARLEPDVHPRAALWAVLTPLLQAADALELWTIPVGLLAQVADTLDMVAESARPASDSFTNPAKALALDLRESLPLIAGAGPLAGIAARLSSDALRLLAGVPAVSVTLPDGIATAVALLSAPVDSDSGDFFRDRVGEAKARPRLVIVGDDGEPDDPALGLHLGAQLQLDEMSARRSAAALHEIATANGARSSRVDVPPGAPLSRLAAAASLGSFTATYLALGSGIDPSMPRPGESPR
jgi:glucose/mannose-6-phosphate isomerase